MPSHFLTVQVSYANMIGDIADRSPGANKHDILNAVGSDSRVGKKYELNNLCSCANTA